MEYGKTVPTTVNIPSDDMEKSQPIVEIAESAAVSSDFQDTNVRNDKMEDASSPSEPTVEPVVGSHEELAQPTMEMPVDSATPSVPTGTAKPATAEATTGKSDAAVSSSSATNKDRNSSAEIAKIINSGKLSPSEGKNLRNLLNDHAALKVKVDRLKGLLGRSAKAQREAKVELEATLKRLEQVTRDNQRLKDKVDHLSSRPTHMDLLNDFETNFDRALLSVGKTGGEDVAAPTGQDSPMIDAKESAVDAMLMQELEESRTRLAKLESINSALVQRSSQLEADSRERKRERDEAAQKLSHMELELRMAKMEAAHAQRAMEEKAASLDEMQMEIDLVTKASMKANVRAAHGEAVAKSSKTDRQHVIQLEAQVQALKEWALASAESKRLALERVSLLEQKLRNQGVDVEIDGGKGKSVYSKSCSLVVGAGDVGFFVVDLQGKVSGRSRLSLRWKFDATPSDGTTYFNIMKGTRKTSKEQAGATYLIKDRAVVGGAAGEVEGAFTDDLSCTLVWSNKKSWVRPRTVKFTLEVICFED